MATDLSPRQIVVLAIFGIAFWLIAALLLRALAPLGIHQGTTVALVYALVIPGTLPVVLLARVVAGLSPAQLMPGYALATAVAALFDGVALAAVPGLYGRSVEDTAGAGAVILWGAGVGIVLALILGRRGR